MIKAEMALTFNPYMLNTYNILRHSHFLVLELLTVFGTSLVVQWLRLRTPNAGGSSSISGKGTKDPACRN